MITYAILGRGTPMEIADNIIQFSNGAIYSVLDIWHGTNYRPLLSLIETNDLATFVLGSRVIDITLFVLPLLQRITQLLLLVAAASVWLRPEAIPTYRVINIGLLLAMVTSDAGLYSMAYFMLFALMEPWKGVGQRWAIVTCYIIALSVEIPIYRLPELPQNFYFFGGGRAMVSNYVVVGPFIRPALVMVVAVALSLTTIREVWMDVRLQGWAGRWRLRRDAPLLPGVRRPKPRGAE